MTPSRQSTRALLAGPHGAGLKPPLHPLALAHTPFGRAPPPPSALLHRHAAPRPASPPPPLTHYPPPPPPPPQHYHSLGRAHGHGGAPRRERSAASLQMDASDQELMLRSWRRDGRAIALGAALGVLVLVLVAAAAALLGAGPGPRPPRDPFVSMDDVLSFRFRPRRFNASWLPGALLSFEDTHDRLLVLDMNRHEAGASSLINKESLINNLKRLRPVKYIISPDAKYFLAGHSVDPMKSDYEGEVQYAIVDVINQRLRPLEGPHGRKVQRVVWAPAGGALAFVQHNDVFYVADVAAERLAPLRVSHTGRAGNVYNGVPCWSYQVEIFLAKPALWFSPDGRYLAYGSFNDSAVGKVVLPDYFPDFPQGPYPENITRSYPMPGTPLPQASLWLLDVWAATAARARAKVEAEAKLETAAKAAAAAAVAAAVAADVEASGAVEEKPGEQVELVASTEAKTEAAVVQANADAEVSVEAKAEVAATDAEIEEVENEKEGEEEAEEEGMEGAETGLEAEVEAEVWRAQPTRLEVPQELQGSDRTALLGGAVWASAGELAAVWSNRVQDVLKVAVYNASTGALEDVAYSLAARDGGAVDLRARPLFSAGGAALVLAEPLRGSAAFGRGPAEGGGGDGGEDGAATRLLLVRRRRESRAHAVLAKGPVAVRAALAWDEEAHRVYFLGSGEGEPGQQFVWSVPDSSLHAPHAPLCESCALWMAHTRAGTCRYASALFPPDHPPRFFALQCHGPAVPESAIFSVAPPAEAQKERGPLLGWEAQSQLRARVASIVLPWETRVKLPLRRGRHARVRLWLPPNYDVAKAKYPLLLDMNEEWDGSERGSERFKVDWRAHLAANRSIVYAVVAAGNGPPHKGIGQDDVDDQLEAIRELVERFNYIDAARVAVWGWSRGGYLAAMTMARDASRLVRCAIAVSPVVNWNYYNALYAERYLHLPSEDDNAAGYARADLSRHAEGFRGKQLLLMHGTLDEAVHVRHSLLLARELHRLDIPFDFQIYPDEEHNLNRVFSHFHRKMEQFLEECYPLD